MSNQDDKLLSLIEACLKGEEKGWHAFVSDYGKVVRGCLLGYFRGNPQKIDDVTQQVFIKLWKAGLKDFRGTNRYQFLSYLKLITINEAKTYLRLTAGRVREVSIDRDPASSDDPRPVTEIVSGTPNPEQTTSARERLEILTGHLHDLPMEQQQIFLMKAKGYKEKEISDLLGIPEGTVASSYSRIIAKLKNALTRA
jgi:RNA polymerase sigma factor (sigma-70 family)